MRNKFSFEKGKYLSDENILVLKFDKAILKNRTDNIDNM